MSPLPPQAIIPGIAIESGEGWVIGIDLGTTNTSAAVYGPGADAPIPIYFGPASTALPSVVSYKNPRLPVVGQLAKQMVLTDPATTFHGWKRLLGLPERSEIVGRHRDRVAFEIVTGPLGELGTRIDGRVVTFVEVAAFVLDQVRLEVCAVSGHDVSDCVICVPAHFGASQRQAVKRAARRSKLRVLRLVNEPTAAAVAFGHADPIEGDFLVFDFGGGTFDATVLSRRGATFMVKATRGDGALGGMDLDRAVMGRFAEVARQAGVDVTRDPRVSQRVLSAAEKAKCVLSEMERVTVSVPAVGAGSAGRSLDLEHTLSRADLEALTAPLVERAIGVAEQTVALAGIEKGRLSAILLVGGQTRMPLVRRRVAEAFAIAPRSDVDPFTAVAVGAALVGRGAELEDVLSVPIGVMVAGRTEQVFGSNRTLPAEGFVEVPEGEAELPAAIWQAPDVTSAERQLLGVVQVPPRAEGALLKLALSADLELSASLERDGKSEPLRIEDPRRARAPSPPAPEPRRRYAFALAGALALALLAAGLALTRT